MKPVCCNPRSLFTQPPRGARPDECVPECAPEGAAARPRALTRRQSLAMLGAVGATAEVAAQDATKTAPRSYRLVLENDDVRVLEYISRPNSGVCGDGMHTHPKRVTIALKDAKVKVSTAEGATRIAGIPAGSALWGPAVKHRAEDVGGAGARFLIIEIKGKDWLPSTG